MANTFNRKLSRNVGTSLTAVGSYTVASGVTTTAIGLSLANTSTSAILVDVTVNDGTNDTYVLKGALVPAGGAIAAVGGDQKIVLIAGDSVKVKSSAAASLDVVLSILEMT